LTKEKFYALISDSKNSTERRENKIAKTKKEKFADFLGWTGVATLLAGGIEAAKESGRTEARGEEDKITTGHIVMLVGFALAVLAAILGGGKEEEK
jgi:hypothetical protein